MREILFRGKNIKDCQWIYGSYVQELTAIRPRSESTIAPMWRVDESTVGQYTGLTDKNGTKIFDGDILLSQMSEHMYLCYYEYCRFNIEDKYGNMISTEQKFISRMVVEVIGNIHDTKGLFD